MNHKERVLMALNKEQPDRVPFFYWDVPEFGEKMMKHLGLKTRDRLLEYLDVDFRWIEPEYKGPRLISRNKKTKKDIWGVGYSKVKNGDFEYWTPDHFPLQGLTDPDIVDNYPWPSPDLFNFKVLPKLIKRYNDYAIMSAPGYSSPGLFRIMQRLIGKDTFLDIMMLHPKFFQRVADKVTGFYTEFIERFFEYAGNKVDFIRIADDFGSDDGLKVSKGSWEQYCHPAIEQFTKVPRELGVHFYMHSCGAVRKLLPEMISLGADVLDPIQTRADGMEPGGLKRDFGQYITFSGALDEELLLRQGTPADVRKGVKELLDEMAPGGGFFLGPSHKLKVETPVENVIAMYQAAKEWHYSS
jgi:uroporphyrinogen decarboxylase